MYLFLADLVVLIHFLFIVFALFGGLLLYKWFQLIWLHIPALLWGTYIEITGSICPLTPLEKWFREQAGADIYEGGFLSYYLVPIIYPPEYDANYQLIATTILILLNFIIYFGLIWYRLRR
ncbi:MAG: DUF2784 domain-containing protein [Gammaproteobacteria bacterium]|nr:DUF2784 domain-containing protein [Gammaproteobacteria bacterium]